MRSAGRSASWWSSNRSCIGQNASCALHLVVKGELIKHILLNSLVGLPYCHSNLSSRYLPPGLAPIKVSAGVFTSGILHVLAFSLDQPALPSPPVTSTS